MLSVAAVVVTYNRLGKLKKTIDTLLNQSRTPDRLIIVDNASTDGTLDYLQRLIVNHPQVQVIALDRNMGGAGGFNRGIRAGYEAGFDFVWVMDDDCYAYEDALEKLLESWTVFTRTTGYKPGFLCSCVKWHDEICNMNIPEPVWDWPRFVAQENQPVALVNHCSFVSVLIPREKIAKVGLPISDFFIWFDDVEYTKRLSRAGYPGLYVMDSFVHHDLEENQGVNWGLINEKNIWKYEYGARNQAYYRKTNSFLSWAYFSIRTLMKMGKDKLPLALRWRIAKALLKGLSMRITLEHVRAPAP